MVNKYNNLKNFNSKNKEYDFNIKEKLLLEGKINNDFIEKIRFLKLEEIITGPLPWL